METEARSEANQTEPKSRFLANTLQFQIPQDRLKVVSTNLSLQSCLYKVIHMYDYFFNLAAPQKTESFESADRYKPQRKGKTAKC